MNQIVAWKPVPDPVEELAIAADGRSLDPEVIRFKLGDADEHALEQALLLKEKHGGKVTVVAFEAPEVDDALWTALAKGADRAVKLVLNRPNPGTAELAAALAHHLTSTAGPMTPDTLVLAGSQAIDDLEGELAPYLAEILGLPYLGVVSGVTLSEDGRTARVLKEFAGSLRGEFEVPLPAVLGIQSAEKPPRYVPVARVRAVMKSGQIEVAEVPPREVPQKLLVERMYLPEAAGHAEMLEGTPEEVAERLAGILAGRGLI